MGKFKRSKAARLVRSIANRSIVKINTVEKKENSFFYEKYQLIDIGQGKTQISYCGNIIHIGKISDYRVYGDYLCVKLAYSTWECYHKGRYSRKFDSFNGHFYIKADTNYNCSVAYYFTEDNRRCEVDFLSYKLCHLTNHIIFEMTNGRYLILYFVSKRQGIIGNVNKKENMLVFDREKAEIKYTAYLSIGNAMYKKLGNITERMEVCANWQIPYYQGFWNRLFNLDSELKYLLHK